MDEIAKKRAELKQDSREWTALDCLEDLISEIKSGKVYPDKLIIHWLEGQNEEKVTHYYQCAGVTYPDHISLLNLALVRMIDEWRV